MMLANTGAGNGLVPLTTCQYRERLPNVGIEMLTHWSLLVSYGFLKHIQISQIIETMNKKVTYVTKL